MVVCKNQRGLLRNQSIIYDGAFFAKISNGQKPLTVFTKKALSWMFNRVLYMPLRTTQNSALISLLLHYIDFKLFFFAIHTPCFSIFASLLHIFLLTTGWIFHVKGKKTYLLYDFLAKVIYRIIIFFFFAIVRSSQYIFV